MIPILKRGDTMTIVIKKSVATLFAHIIKIDERSIEKEGPLFCKLIGMDFDCTSNEAKELLEDILNKNYDLEEHIETINTALKNDLLCKMHIMEQLNHIIYSDKITVQDYDEFDRIKNALFAPNSNNIAC